MSEHPTIKSIVALWPSRAELAADIDSVDDPVSVDRVDKWCQRASIPSKYHGRIIRAAEKRGLELRAEDIIRAHDRDVNLEVRSITGVAA